MKYFLYCRKSSDREDRQILGPEAQKRLLLEHVQRRALEVSDVFVEHQTAYRTGRPLFNEMLERMEAGEGCAVLTYHLTRLARNSYDGGRLIYMMDEGVIRQIETPEKTYTNNSDDKFLMQIHFAMAKKSSDDTSQFVRRDVESKLLKGEYPGMVPPGFLNITREGHISKGRDSREKYLMLLDLGRPLKREETDPIDGPLIRRLFEVAATGTKSLLALRKLSYDLGLRSPRGGKMLSKHALCNLLVDPYYYGVIEYRGKVYTENIQHEPLITKELFDQVQDALAGRGKGRYRKHSFAFGSGLIRCGECGCPITAESKKGHVYYHCTHNRGPCPESAWTREEVIEEQMLGLLTGLQLPQAFLDYALKKLRKAHAYEARFSDSLRRKHQARVNECQEKLNGLLQLKISPKNAGGVLLSDEEYLEQKTVLKQELDSVKRQLASAQQQGETWIEDCERFFDFTQRMSKKFENASPEEKKGLVLLVCRNLTLKGHKVAAAYKEVYAALSDFPLAGKAAVFPSEPRIAALESAKYVNAANWLGTLTAIRTFCLTGEQNTMFGALL